MNLVPFLAAREFFNSLAFFRPESVLCATILAVILADALFQGSRKIVTGLALFGTGAAFLLGLPAFGAPEGEMPIFSGMLVADGMTAYFRAVLLLAAFVSILLALPSRELRGRGLGEFYALLLSVALGTVLLAGASNLLMVYLALELVSVPSFVLVAYDRGDRAGTEAALKYVLVGATSTGIMLFGITLLFGFTGTYDLGALGEVLAGRVFAGADAWLVLVAGVMVLAGFAFKIAAAPFHFWAPDVYTGATAPVAAFLTVGPKAAGFAALLRFLQIGTAGGQGIRWWSLLWVIAILTMTVGNLGAFFQNNLKRLLGYSSIAHAGYMLMGAVALSDQGTQAILLYLAIYLTMNLGAFLTVILLHRETGSFDLRDYRGLARSSPWMTLALAVFFFSLIGIPPFAGFWGKYYLFVAVIQKGYIGLAVAGALNTILAVFYYARVIKTMVLEEAEKPAPRVGVGPAAGILVTALALPNILFLVVFWGPLHELVVGYGHFWRP